MHLDVPSWRMAEFYCSFGCVVGSGIQILYKILDGIQLKYSIDIDSIGKVV